jgi:hypothetical protein
MKTQVLKETSVGKQLQDIRMDITWSKLSRRYFDKPASWMYNKLNGVDENGNEEAFAYSEKIQLRNALYDFSERIRKAAYNIVV